MRLIWSQEALERLEDIQYYLAVNQQSPQAAASVLARLFAAVPQIESMPMSGRQMAHYDDPNLREHLVNPYRIIYHINAAKDQIVVLSVMHQRQLLPKVKEMQAAARAYIDAIEKEH